MLAPWKKSYDQLGQHIKKADSYQSMAKSEELKSLLMKVKEEREKAQHSEN